MWTMLNNKRFLSIGIVLAFITVIVIFQFIFSTKHYDSISQIIQYRVNQNYHNTTSPRIFCLILTSPNSFLSRTKAINETWAPRCDRYFFITEYIPETLKSEQIQFAEQIPIAPIKNITAGYDHLTQKSTLAFLFAYENYFNDFDWFIKADDDTFLIIEHLKAFLREQNTSEPVTFGYNFKVIVPKGYHSGGGSYVLSRESLRRFYEAHQDPALNCRKDGGSEDVEVANCLRKKGVYPGKSLDKQNRELFHPLSFADHFRGTFPDWLLQYAENPLGAHYNCCSDQTISFHYVPPEEQYLMNFLLYRTQVKSNTFKSNSSMT
ncbi:unnamed protein product [Rotaria magnacalcarata]|uniref:N-acetylgalactosaminide beta-1,3-galactosyltransferase n=1 Tax=Rotaria magnacalcarata TaxID=392030 RepID=A0A816PIP0_9BILA|nr:unnamed protein product [Rotaria magnacalcarata]